MTTKAVHMEATFGTSRYDAAMKHMRKTSKSTMSSIRSHFLGVTVAGAALVASYNKITAAAIEQEQVEKRLASVVRSTGGASGYTAKQMYEMAAGMQAVTTVGDETIIAGQAMLGTFKKIQGEAFQRTMMAALDLSDVMQQNLRSSIVMLGKALNDPVANLGALSRAGIQFTAEQKETIKTLWKSNRAMEAQAMMLDEIESQFGGAAKAARTTYGGAVKSLGNTMGDLVEQIGFAVTKNKEVITSINELGDAVAAATPGIAKFAKNVVWLAQDIGWLYGETEKLLSNLYDVLIGNAIAQTIRAGEATGAWIRQLLQLKDVQSGITYHPIGPGTPGYEGYANQGGGGGSGDMGGGPESSYISSTLIYDASQIADMWLAFDQGRQDAHQRALEMIEQMDQLHYEQENQSMLDHFALQGEMLQESYGAQEMARWQHDEKMAQLRDEYERKETQSTQKITQMKLQSAQMIMSMTQQFLGNIQTMTDKNNKAIFYASKALAIGQAIVYTHMSTAMALATPPAPNLPLGALAKAVGYANVAAIIGTTLTGGGGAGGGAGGGGGSGNISYPEVTPTEVIAPDDTKGSLHIHIGGDVVGNIDDQWVDNLVDRVNDASDREVYINYSYQSGELVT